MANDTTAPPFLNAFLRLCLIVGLTILRTRHDYHNSSVKTCHFSSTLSVFVCCCGWLEQNIRQGNSYTRLIRFYHWLAESCSNMSSEIDGLKQVFPQLVARLQASDIIDHLYQSNLVTEAEFDGFVSDISQKSDLRDVNRRILMAVRKGPEGSVVKFEEILRTSQPDLAGELRRGT